VFNHQLHELQSNSFGMWYSMAIPVARISSVRAGRHRRRRINTRPQASLRGPERLIVVKIRGFACRYEFLRHRRAHKHRHNTPLTLALIRRL